CWFDPNHWFGFDGRFFFLGERTGQAVFGGDSNGSPLLSIPFNDLNAVLPGPSFTQVANPGVSTGQARFASVTRLWGLEANLDCPSLPWLGLAISTLIGFRYVELTERCSIVQDVMSVGQLPLLSFQGVPIPGSDSLRISDAFSTRNQFYGGNLAVRASGRL